MLENFGARRLSGAATIRDGGYRARRLSGTGGKANWHQLATAADLLGDFSEDFSELDVPSLELLELPLVSLVFVSDDLSEDLLSETELPDSVLALLARLSVL